MPSHTDRKLYIAGAVYHVYNRGVNKRKIFSLSRGMQDYKVFLRIFRSHLHQSPGIKLLQYALMPNHYHFVLRQENSRDMPVFMKRVMQEYVTYFNKRNRRVGPLFQSRYQAALLRGRNRIRIVCEYVKNNPKEAGLKNWPYVGKKM